MTDSTHPTSRRTIVLGAAAVAGLPLLAATSAQAGVVTQANAKYQAKPKGAAQCSLCSYYIPGKKPTDNGACKQVAGVIAPTGWCQFYAKKPGAK